MTDNTAIWDALGKTDPSHTKGFSRAGGFKGTSVKPMWVLHRLTEQFGPAGEGWGVNEPTFQVVHGEGEILVYCTVSAWHGKRENVLWGVGGDKVTAKRNSGPFNDDEAFKKAFTDAVNNAFKSIGVAADIHMGLFDDDKYVASMREEFADEPEQPQQLPEGPINDKTRDWLAAQIDATGHPVGEFCKAFEVTSLKAIQYDQMDAVRSWLRNNVKAA
jgi:hypothetical protein